MELNGKNILVFGLAKSGLAAIKLLSHYPCKITLIQNKDINQLEERDEIISYGVKLLEQKEENFDIDYDICIKNPGIPFKSKYSDILNKHHCPIITEIELAYQLAKKQHYIAITGSNGKTTTTTIVYEILKKAFKEKAHVCGNIGTPLCDCVLDNNLLEEEGHYIALEISNFQLLNIDKFKPEIATIINLSPDHLDFMSLEEYYDSKLQVYRNMKDDDYFILNNDDDTLIELTNDKKINCIVSSFSLDNNNADSYCDDEYIIINQENVLPLNHIRLVGKHNRQNIIIACIIAKRLGISNEIIDDVISHFNGVEHRIEFVRELYGVKYYNDSKGTNTDATITALKAFDKNVILLIGGFEKGLDMSEMAKNLQSVKAIIGYGACGKRLIDDLHFSNSYLVENLNQATDLARSIAISGDTILLSPTTSSFDQYTCYEERGDHFKEIVNKYE